MPGRPQLDGGRLPPARELNRPDRARDTAAG